MTTLTAINTNNATEVTVAMEGPHYLYLTRTPMAQLEHNYLGILNATWEAKVAAGEEAQFMAAFTDMAENINRALGDFGIAPLFDVI